MNYVIQIHFLDGSEEDFIFSSKGDANTKISLALRQGYFSLEVGSQGQSKDEIYIPLNAIKKIILKTRVAK
jgi:hypothetical protein